MHSALFPLTMIEEKIGVRPHLTLSDVYTGSPPKSPFERLLPEALDTNCHYMFVASKTL